MSLSLTGFNSFFPCEFGLRAFRRKVTGNLKKMETPDSPAESSHATNPNLLTRLQQGDQSAWQEFVNDYEGLLFHFAKGWPNLDAEDLVGEMKLKLVKELPKFDYDRATGRFRGWLLTVFRHLAIDMLRKHGRPTAIGGSTNAQVIENLPEHEADEFARRAQQKFERRLLQRAEMEIRPANEAHWRAWELRRQNYTYDKIASETGLTPAAAKQAVWRIVQRLKRLAADLEREFDELEDLSDGMSLD